MEWTLLSRLKLFYAPVEMYQKLAKKSQIGSHFVGGGSPTLQQGSEQYTFKTQDVENLHRDRKRIHWDVKHLRKSVERLHRV